MMANLEGLKARSLVVVISLGIIAGCGAPTTPRDAALPDGGFDSGDVPGDAARPDTGAPDVVTDAAGDIDAPGDAPDAPMDGGAPDVAEGGAPTCAPQPSNFNWALVSINGGPSTVQVIAPGEVWGISLGKLQRWDGGGWADVAVPFAWAQTQVTGDGGRTIAATVRGSGAKDVWVTNGATVIARWDGTSWTDVSPPALPAGSRLSEMRVLSPGDAWVANTFPLPLDANNNQYFASSVLHWNGATWTEVPLPAEAAAPVELRTIWATSRDDVWVGGVVYRQGLSDALVLHWDGTALRAPTFGPFTSGRQFIGGIWASSARDVWVAGGSFQIGAKLSHYDGSAWTEVSIPEGQGIFTAIWGTAACDVWALGGGIWHYDGSTWSRFSPGLGSYGAISGSGPDDVWTTAKANLPKEGLSDAQLLLRWQVGSCGDRFVGAGEACDPPRPLGAKDIPVCDQTCHIPTCGNLALDGTEECDPPDEIVCDRQCRSIPIVCGNGIVQPGEGCEIESGLCSKCQVTTCGACFAVMGGGGICSGLTGEDAKSCNALVACMSPGLGQCAATFGAVGCYCKDPSCSQGADGPCGGQFQALAHSTVPAEVIRQVSDPTTPVGRVSAGMVRFSHSSCGRHCF